MKSFNQFIYEQSKINWTTPHHTDEHDEIHAQHKDLKHDKDTPEDVKKMLHNFRDKNKFSKAMKKGKTTKITRKDSIGNSMHQDPNARKTMEKSKVKRVDNLVKNNEPINRPVVARNKRTGKRWLIGGNTRGHKGTELHGHFQAHEIEY